MAEILLIDDMPGVRRAVTNMLGRAGHSVTVSENGTQGLEMLKSRKFDLVVTDMLMPGADTVTEWPARPSMLVTARRTPGISSMRKIFPPFHVLL